MRYADADKVIKKLEKERGIHSVSFNNSNCKYFRRYNRDTNLQ